MKRFLRAAAAAAVALVAAAALGASTETQVPGLGAVSVKWNDVRYRKELVAQLQPGLTWRLGANDATRLQVTGMALAAEGGLLLPGEMTLNVRYWSADSWSLVVFEEDDWKWSADKRHFAVVPVRVWKEQDAKKHAPKLSLALRAVTGKTRTAPPVAVTTPATGKPAVELAPPVTYSKEAQAESDKAPWVELEMRFGDLAGLAAFEAAEAGKLAAKSAAGKAHVLHWPRFRDVRARTELAETGTEMTIGRLREEGTPAREWLLVLAGGALPELQRLRLGKDESLPPIEGKRVETTKEPKQVTWEHDGQSLILHLHRVDYVFPL